MKFQNIILRNTNLFLFVFLNLVNLVVHAQQDTLYYNNNWKLTVKDSAAYFRPPVQKQGSLYKIEDYYSSGQLQMRGMSTKSDNNLWQGEVTWYNEDGSVLQQATYNNGKLEGKYISYLNDKRLEAVFKNGRIISGKTNGKWLKNRRYYQEVRGDTVVNIIYENDINGARFERYSLGSHRDKLVKYYDHHGKFIGQRELLHKGNFRGLEVFYYETPMRPMQIIYYPNGKRLGSTFFYCNNQVREQFNMENELSKTYFSPDGKKIGKIEYSLKNDVLRAANGRKITFFSNYNKDKTELIRSIREYSNSKLKKDEQFYENQNLKSKTIYTDGKKELQISYNEAGQEIARMVYNNWNPVEGTEIIGNGSKTYKDGKLVKELNYYQDTNLIFSRKTSDLEIYYNKNGEELGRLILKDDNGYQKPTDGYRYFIDREGDIRSEELYSNGYRVSITSYYSRRVAENVTKKFKTIELTEPDSFKKNREQRFYSNGVMQSDIKFSGYTETLGTFYNKQGEKIGEYDYKAKDGKLFVFFRNSDQLKSKAVFKNGKQLSLKRYDYGIQSKYGEINPVLVEDIDITCCAKFYTRNGELIAEAIYKDGKPWEGQIYDPQIRTKYTIAKGVRHGAYKKYDYNHNVLESGNFVEDKADGLFTYYDYSGNILKKETYKNGLLEGLASYYDKNGKLLSEMSYKADKPMDGTRIVQLTFNGVETNQTFANGELVQSIYSDDKGKRLAFYENGTQVKGIAYYGDTNNKRFSYRLKGRNLHGEVVRYNKEGKAEYKAVFDDGKLKEGGVLLNANGIKGKPEYMILERDLGTVKVRLMGQNNKVLLKAEEVLTFGTATVFIQNLNIYINNIKPEDLY
ncbi:hypothetical protein FEZ18_02110 [Oceanihabitans sp. IOP_32]|uniref:toxin-antitoxin system YwqK family antitoxin n=1 Tax=Oceanihabitans sp. IOP_32 TaxID=2529032 RepID=UPI001292E8D0|nr:hypothetical protein [Oceanihabitans sp. IOP_32]QFZ53681.1 hypothetical protein FEZ18_02110 [Oceanihabitans sp. IOP_32]